MHLCNKFPFVVYILSDLLFLYIYHQDLIHRHLLTWRLIIYVNIFIQTTPLKTALSLSTQSCKIRFSFQNTEGLYSFYHRLLYWSCTLNILIAPTIHMYFNPYIAWSNIPISHYCTDKAWAYYSKVCIDNLDWTEGVLFYVSSL